MPLIDDGPAALERALLGNGVPEVPGNPPALVRIGHRTGQFKHAGKRHYWLTFSIATDT
ncbi:hypothetical protein GCM10010407_04080 [Rarobacter incanus]